MKVIKAAFKQKYFRTCNRFVTKLKRCNLQYLAPLQFWPKGRTSLDLSKIPLFKSPGCFVRVVVDFTIKNVRQNRANNHPTLVSNNHKWRGALGFYRNRKTAENNPKPQKIGSKPKTACKTVKTEEFSHSSSQKKPQSIQYSGDKWSIQKFRGHSKSVVAHNRRSERRETGTQIGRNRKPYRIPNPKTH